jgi:lipopolysaccharide export system permease protein
MRSFMKILRNYFLNEFLAPLLLAIFVLTLVMLLGNLIKIADLVINKGVDILSVGKLFVFMIPYLLTYTLPIATLTAALISIGRLAGDNEITAIRASGINLFSLILPLLIVAFIMSLGLLVFNDRVTPYAHFAARKTLVEVGIKNPTAALEPGVFIDSFQNYVLFIYRVDQKNHKLHHIRIYEPRPDGRPTRTIVARSGEFIAEPEKNMIKLKLVDGTSDEPDPNNPGNFYKLNFKNYFMTLNLAQLQNRKNLNKKPKDMTLNELQTQIEKRENEGIDAAPLIVHFHEKIALAFSCFVFMLLGIPLAILTRRREKSINFGLAVIIVGAYYLLLIAGEALSLQGYMEPAITTWLANIIFGLIGIILTIRICAY